MSYSIVYDRKFIKVDKGIIPLVLSGSNNVYQGKRRVRSWFPAFLPNNSGFIINENVFYEHVVKNCLSSYDENFKMGGKWIDNEALKLFIVNGIKNAMTIEEYLENSTTPLFLNFHMTVKNESTSTVVDKVDTVIKTTEELIKHHELVKKYQNEGYQVDSNIGWYDDEPLKINKNTVIEGKCVLKKGHYYLCEFDETPRISCTMTKDQKNAIVYNDYSSALNVAKKISDNFNGDNFKIVKYRDISKLTEIVISLGQGYYFIKKTKRGIRYSAFISDAKIFYTKGEAERYIKKHNIEKWFPKCEIKDKESIKKQSI